MQGPPNLQRPASLLTDHKVELAVSSFSTKTLESKVGSPPSSHKKSHPAQRGIQGDGRVIFSCAETGWFENRDCADHLCVAR